MNSKGYYAKSKFATIGAANCILLSIQIDPSEEYNLVMGYREIKRKTITPKQRQEILKRDGNICGYCREPRRRKPSSLVIDHIIPVRDGGYHGPENWVTACRSCNRMKWLHSPNEEGAPRLRWFSGRSVAKVTTMGVRYKKRVPIISFKHR